MKWLRKLKNLFVQDRIEFQKVRFGVCSDLYLPINLRNEFRTMLGLKEREISKFISSSIKKGFCCYDIGAGYGYYTFTFGKLCNPGFVVAFEREKQLCELIKQGVFKNNQLKTEFFIKCSSVGKNSNTVNNYVSIDDCVFKNELPPPDFIKVDIEGNEYEALIGAKNVIRQYSPQIIIEVHSIVLEERCATLLKNFGYKITIINQKKYFPEHRVIPHNRWIYCKK